MRQTTKGKVLSFIGDRDWVSGTEIEDQASRWLTKPSTASRRARELADDGQLDRKLVKGCVWYKKRFTGPVVHSAWAVGLAPPNQLFETAPPRFNANPKAK